MRSFEFLCPRAARAAGSGHKFNPTASMDALVFTNGCYIRVKSMYQLVSQVLPASEEVACSQCADVAVIFDQVYRVRMSFPFRMPSA